MNPNITHISDIATFRAHSAPQAESAGVMLLEIERFDQWGTTADTGLVMPSVFTMVGLAA